MKIAIISDIHENFHNLILALQDMDQHNIAQILCLGDLMNSGIAKVLAAQEIPVFMIWGNNDGEKVDITLCSKRANSALTVSSNTYDFLEFDGRKIFITHYENLAKPMAQSGIYDAVFYGHNHLQATAKINKCWVVNPGEIAAGKTKKASYAIYDTLTNDVSIIFLKDTVSLKTPLMEAYFKEHGHKMGLRSKILLNPSPSEATTLTATDGLPDSHSYESNDMKKSIIPKSSPVFHALQEAATTAKVLVFSGLPGVGKSLYINQFQLIAAASGRKVTVIQWDIARKAFETPVVAARYPMGDGVVHNGVKLSVGLWLMETLKDWLKLHPHKEDLLLIEAPLVGHRFIELAKIQEEPAIEAFLKSTAFQILVPIPSKQVRAKIEAERRAQIADDAATWVGAKPSVMLMLWKMICGIANEFGRTIPMDSQPPYDPEVYTFVFGEILKHRHFKPLPIDEIFEVQIANEADLHNTGSLAAAEAEANKYCAIIDTTYVDKEAIDAVVASWYLT